MKLKRQNKVLKFWLWYMNFLLVKMSTVYFSLYTQKPRYLLYQFTLQITNDFCVKSSQTIYELASSDMQQHSIFTST